MITSKDFLKMLTEAKDGTVEYLTMPIADFGIDTLVGDIDIEYKPERGAYIVLITFGEDNFRAFVYPGEDMNTEKASEIIEMIHNEVEEIVKED